MKERRMKAHKREGEEAGRWELDADAICARGLGIGMWRSPEPGGGGRRGKRKLVVVINNIPRQQKAAK